MGAKGLLGALWEVGWHCEKLGDLKLDGGLGARRLQPSGGPWQGG